MLPSEMIILMAIGVNKRTASQLLTRPMDVTSEYIGYLYTSLVNRGYLRQRGAADYQLTPVGRQAILDFLQKNKTSAQTMLKRLKLMGIEVNAGQERRLDKLEKECARHQ